MPYQGKVPVTEKNNYPQGRSGGETKKHEGPVTSGIKHNPTNSGGINRATKGKGGAG